jgi:integrase
VGPPRPRDRCRIRSTRPRSRSKAIESSRLASRDWSIGGGASRIGPDASQRGEPVMSSGSTIQVNAAGRRRSPATMPGYLAGRAPRNKGMEYPPDPPRPEEIVLVMRQAGQDRHGLRVRALVAVLWRGGLRISEALALNETDIDERRGSLLIRHGKGDRRREAGMDQFRVRTARRLANAPRAVAARAAVVCHRQGNPRPALVRDRSASRVAPARRRRRRTDPLTA